MAPPIPLQGTRIPRSEFNVGFSYKPLDRPGQFRILEVDPGEADFASTISCTLRHVLITDAADYEAISYVWGDDPDITSIMVNGEPFYIFLNVWHTLLFLRNKDKPRALWIDAICIDQRNLSERNIQVAIMCTIYENSRRTIVWLGIGSEEAIHCLESISQLAETWEPIDECDHSTLDCMQDSSFHFADERSFAAMVRTKLFIDHTAWFSRIWIIQEVRTAKEAVLVYGRPVLAQGICQVQLQDLKQVVHILTRHRIMFHLHERGDIVEKRAKFIRTFRRSLIQRASILFDSLQDVTMEQLVNLTRNYLSTDPRDRFFALHGLTRAMTSIEPDYHKTRREIYAITTKHIILQAEMNYLSILRYIGQIEQSGIDELPSWVPQYDNLHSLNEDSWLDSGLYNASGGEQVNKSLIDIKDEMSNFVLRLEGVKVDVMERILDFSIDRTPNGELPIASGEALYPGSSETLESAHFRTLIADGFTITPKNVDSTDGNKGYCINTDIVKRRFRSNDLPIPPSTNQEIRMIYQARHKTLQRNLYKYIATEKGYLGLVTNFALPGDCICVLKGGNVPVVLRQLNHSGYWILVGEAYLHGYMDGEIIKELEASQVEWEVFALK